MTEEMDENLRALENYLAGLFDGELKSERKREKENQTLIVKNLLKNSVPDDIIVNSTNISYKELENIKKKLK